MVGVKDRGSFSLHGSQEAKKEGKGAGSQYLLCGHEPSASYTEGSTSNNIVDYGPSLKHMAFGGHSRSEL